MTAEELFDWWKHATPRQRDNRVATQAMGFSDAGNTYQGTEWEPSTSIRDAWQVADWLRERWGTFTLLAGSQWHCYASEGWRGLHWGFGDTPMEAICLAALLEVEVKVAKG